MYRNLAAALLLGCGILLTGNSTAADHQPIQAEELVTTAPNPYVVQPGDTLWGIAAKFLRNPKQWPHIWERNPQFADPHAILPGDRVYFRITEEGQPELTVKSSTTEPLPVVKLAPAVAYGPVSRQEQMLTNSQKDVIQLFLRQNILITESGIASHGYLVAETIQQRQSLGEGDHVFIKYDGKLTVGDTLAIYRPGKSLTDPLTDEKMGTLADHMGVLRVDMVTPEGGIAQITDSFRDIAPGDLLTPHHAVNTEFDIVTTPPPVTDGTELPMEGRVLLIHIDQDEGGANMVVTVGVGRRNRAVQGLVLPVYRKGEDVVDPLTQKKVTLPSRRIGYAVIFYVGEKASHAILTQTTEPVHRGDMVSLR